jgi:hypothetical protein
MGDMESVQQQLKCSNNDNDLTTTTAPTDFINSLQWVNASENTNTSRENIGTRSYLVKIISTQFLEFLCYGEVIISLLKTAKADANERCKHHTWSHHFELQTSQSEEHTTAL